MKPEHHTPAEEEIMAYLDGELESADAARVRQHLDECAACAGIAASFRDTSAAINGWELAAVPPFASRVRDIRSAPSWWKRAPRRSAALAAAAILVLAVGVTTMRDRATPGDSAMMVAPGGGEQGRLNKPQATVTSTSEASPVANSTRAMAAVPDTATGPLLVRTARLMLTSADFEAVRGRFERIVSDAGGFMGQIVVSGSAREQRSLSATVRVPAAQFEKTIAALRGLGTVTSEAQDGEDVTQQSVDLDARLTNARASEARLKTILEQRTGRLSDVLDVEREISRVRGEIERMEAERKNLDRRITYASIDVTLLEERKAAMDFGPLPLSTRFRNAFVDGWTTAVGGVVEAGLVVTGLLPTLFVVTLVAAPVVLRLRRARQRRPASA